MALKAIELQYAYGDREVLRGVNLSVDRGELLGVIGPNGCGKSTLLGILAGLLTPPRGQVLLEGRPLQSIPRRELARRMGLVPQSPQIAPGFTVLETVLTGRYALMGRRMFDDAEDRDAAGRVLRDTGLAELARRPAGELSGGERQRLALARALACGPGLLLLDEPTSALGLENQLRIMRLLEGSCADDGRAVCLVSHDLNLAAMFCTRLILLAGGRVLAAGAPAEVVRPELIRQAYGVAALVDAEPTRGRPRVTVVP